MKTFIFIFYFFSLIIINCQTCSKQDSINNTDCFNEVLYINLDNRYYRAGHFATNKNGDMIIEYSYEIFRLFFGLTKDGKFYFQNVTKEVTITSETIHPDSLNRYEAVNYFISPANDTNKERENLLSISSYITVSELHDLENDKYSLKESVALVEKTLGIYSYVFQLLETQINGENIYFLIYIHVRSNTDVFPNSITIKKFKFLDLNYESIVHMNEIVLENNGGTRITSSIIMDYNSILALFFIQYDGTRYNYHVNFYDFDLTYKWGSDIAFGFTDLEAQNGIFLKLAIYIMTI